MRRAQLLWLVGGLFGVLLLCGLCAGLIALAAQAGGGEGGTAGADAVQIVRVEGQIVSGEGAESPFGTADVAYAGRISRELKRARETRSVRAIVLRVDSPGGDVVASDEIHNAVKKTRDAGKPVVVSMGSTAASGGYYVSAPADRIFANPATVTGSIGVISVIPNVQKLLEEKLGVEMQILKTGEHKDDSTMVKPLNDAERAILQAVINDMYDQFVNVVATGRQLEENRVRELADGRIYTGKQALERKLIDEFGGLDEAVAHAGKLGGITGEPRVIDRQRNSFWESLFNPAGAATTERSLIATALRRLHLDQPVGFKYLYAP